MIISFGELLVDMIKIGDGFHPFPGGAPANFAVGCSRLGKKVYLIATVGNDYFGKMLLQKMVEEKVDISCVRIENFARTTLAFVTLVGGKPSFFFYRGADKFILEDQIQEELFKKNKIFHFGSLSLTDVPVRETLFYALELAKKNSLEVSFDPNFREDLWKSTFNNYLLDALEYVHILLPSVSELEYIGEILGLKTKDLNDLLDEICSAFRLKLIAVTRGEKGSLLFKGNLIEQPAFKVKVVDTTGAGDAFAAGLIVGKLMGFKEDELLRFANACAAISITKYGAMSALPTIDEVRNFLLSNKV